MRCVTRCVGLRHSTDPLGQLSDFFPDGFDVCAYLFLSQFCFLQLNLFFFLEGVGVNIFDYETRACPATGGKKRSGNEGKK